MEYVPRLSIFYKGSLAQCKRDSVVGRTFTCMQPTEMQPTGDFNHQTPSIVSCAPPEVSPKCRDRSNPSESLGVAYKIKTLNGSAKHKIRALLFNW